MEQNINTTTTYYHVYTAGQDIYFLKTIDKNTEDKYLGKVSTDEEFNELLKANGFNKQFRKNFRSRFKQYISDIVDKEKYTNCAPMFTEDVDCNGLGVNNKIKFHFNKENLTNFGFRYAKPCLSIPASWYYMKMFSFKGAEFDFAVHWYLEPYKGAQLSIDLLDDDFCQPYDYQHILSKNPENICAHKVLEFVEKEMKKLQDAGILSGHVEGEYI